MLAGSVGKITCMSEDFQFVMVLLFSTIIVCSVKSGYLPILAEEGVTENQML